MTDVTSRQLPPPRDWQAFERLTFDLFSRLWQTNDAEMHGRTGQPQSGVDVYGTDRKEHARAGVQCKGKDADYGSALSEAELRAEIEKAKSFSPKLDVFTLVTTAANDQAVQAVARSITEQHAAEGLFEVRVHGWDTLRQRITDYPDLLTKHFADFAPFELVDNIKEQHEETRAIILQEIRNVGSQLVDDSAPDEINIRITTISSFIKKGNMLAAIDGLNEIAEEKDKLHSRHFFRIHANLGIAYYAVGNVSLAIENFEAAFLVTPDTASAKAYLGLARLLQGNRGEAFELATEALKLDPSQLQAVNVIFDAMPDGTPPKELLAIIPKDLHEHPDVLHGLAIQFRANGDLSAAEHFARLAFEKDSDNWLFQSTLAECIIEPVLDEPELALTRILTPEKSAKLEEGMQLLLGAWKNIKVRDDARRGAHVAANLISVLELCERESEADYVLDEALRAAPDYAPLLVRSAVRALDLGAIEDAIQALQSVPPDKREPRDQALFIQALMAADRHEEALELARESEGSLAGRDSELFAALALEAAAGAASLPQEIERVSAAHPDSIIVKSAVASSLQDDDSRRLSILTDLASKARDTSQAQSRFHAAQALLRAKMYSAAADLYSGLHGDDRDTPTLRGHIRALYFADRRREARELFEGLAENVKFIDFYTEMGAAIYERSGLLPKAIGLLEARLAREETLPVRLKWMALCERQGRLAEVEQWLESVPPDLEGSAYDLMSVAQAIDRHLADPKCLPIAYRALRQGFNDPQIHTVYALGLFLMGRIGRTVFEVPDTVQMDTAVVLEETETGDRLFRIIESEDNPEIVRDEISPESQLARRLIGCRVGDELTLESLGPNDRKFRIAEIQNKFLFAHFRTLNKFDELFPDSKLIGSFQLKGEGSDQFDALFASVRSRSERMQPLWDAYREGKLPVFLLAKMGGGSPFEAWESVYLSPELEIGACQGLFGEMQAAAELLAAKPVLVIDPITLWGLVRMGVAEAVKASVEKLAIVQSSIDLIRDEVEDRRAKRGTQQGSLISDGDKVRFIELTDEAIESLVSEGEKVLTFAETLSIVPAEGIEPPSERAQELLEDVSPAFLDTIMASQGADRLLYSDDRVLRLMAQEAAGAQGVWTQAVAHFGLQAARIQPPAYFSLVLELLKSGHVFTVVGAGNFLNELEVSSWEITDAVRILCRGLMKATNDQPSVIVVLSDLIRLAWGQRPSAAEFAQLVEALGQAGQDGRTSEELRNVFEAAMRRVRRTFMINGRRVYLRPLLLGSTIHQPQTKAMAQVDETARALAEEIRSVINQALDNLFQADP